MSDIIIPAIQRKIIDRELSPFQLDLIAYYKILEEKTNRIVSQGIGDGKTPEDIIKDVEQLFEGKVGK